MKDDSSNRGRQQKTERGTLGTYVSGFVLSIALTIVAFFAVQERLLEGWVLVGLIMGLAVIQLFVQLFFFLHLGREQKPRWNLLSFLFAVLVVGIVVIGSLWIMNNLNYQMMPQDMNQYMLNESSKGF